MDFIFWIIIAAAVLPILGWIFWIVVFVWLAKTVVSGVERELRNELQYLERTFGQINTGGGQQVSPHQSAQIMQMLTSADLHMRQMDNLSRQRYDVRMGELSGMAASAGLDWSPSDY